MTLTLTVTVEVERLEGKFESKETLGGLLVELVQDALNGEELEGDNEGRYEVTSVEAELSNERPRK